MSQDTKTNLLYSVGVALLTILIFILSYFVLTPYFFRVPADFHYSADVISVDNLYNEKTKAFSGENRSTTLFEYSIKGNNNGKADINGIFDVRSTSGEEIISLRHDLSLDQYSWKQITPKGVSGYIFGPRNISKNDTFYYKHISYDEPVKMVFSGEEVIDGVNTYRFTSEFISDQTETLSYLPGVPKERGVTLDVKLTLWIEPVSGWLVSYADQASAYFYDQKTKERINPWNTFRNRYTETSIDAQAKNADAQRIRILMSEFGPAILFLLLGLIFIGRHASRRVKVIGSFIILVLVGLVIFGVVFKKLPTRKPLVIGISRWVPVGNTSYDKNIQGFKDGLAEAGYAEGSYVVYDLKVADADANRQKEIANSFNEKKVSLIYSLTTPGTLILKNNVPNIPIVFSVVTYPVEAGVIKSLIHSENNLVGTRNWVPIEYQLSVFRELVPDVRSIGFVHRDGEVNSTIQLGEMRVAAKPYGIKVVEIAGHDLSELEAALNSAKVGSIFSACDTLVQGEAEKTIIAFAQKNKIPSFSCNNSGPMNGDLLGAVADLYEIGKMAGEKAALILEGVSPSSIETETVTRPLIYVNQKTADLLNIEIPRSTLSKTTEIIR